MASPVPSPKTAMATPFWQFLILLPQYNTGQWLSPINIATLQRGFPGTPESAECLFLKKLLRFHVDVALPLSSTRFCHVC